MKRRAGHHIGQISVISILIMLIFMAITIAFVRFERTAYNITQMQMERDISYYLALGGVEWCRYMRLEPTAPGFPNDASANYLRGPLIAGTFGTIAIIVSGDPAYDIVSVGSRQNVSPFGVQQNIPIIITDIN